MLRLLIIFFLLIFNSVVFGQNTFFESKVDFFKNDSEQEKIIKKPTEEQPKCVQCSLQNPIHEVNSSTSSTVSIKLFINPDCKYSESAINLLKDTLNNNKDFRGYVYIIGSSEKFWNFVFTHRDIAKLEIPMSLDSENLFDTQYKIKQTPAFIIEKNGRISRILGQPDLEDVIKNKI